MGFGSLSAISIILVSPVALKPLGIQVAQLQTVALGLVEAFGMWGVYLFAATLFICCFGAAAEVALALSYEITQMRSWANESNIIHWEQIDTIGEEAIRLKVSRGDIRTVEPDGRARRGRKLRTRPSSDSDDGNDSEV
jgi:hypothetical protein